MTLAQLKSVLDGTGIPVTYRTWEIGHVPPMPYICFLATGSDNFAADGIVYHSNTHVNVELYMESIDESVMREVQDAMDAAGIYWESDIFYLDTERCYQIIYECEV